MNYTFSNCNTDNIDEAITIALQSPTNLREFKFFLRDHVVDAFNAYKSAASDYNSDISKELSARMQRLGTLDNERGILEKRQREAEEKLGAALVMGDMDGEAAAETELEDISKSIEGVDKRIDLFKSSVVGCGDKSKFENLKQLYAVYKSTLDDVSAALETFYNRFWEHQRGMEEANKAMLCTGNRVGATGVQSLLSNDVALSAQYKLERFEKIIDGVSLNDIEGGAA